MLSNYQERSYGGFTVLDAIGHRDDFAATRLVVELLRNFEANDRRRIMRWALEKLEHGSARAKAGPKANVEGDGGPAGVMTYDRVLSVHRAPNDKVFVAAVAYAHQHGVPAEFSKDYVGPDDVSREAARIGRSGPKFPGQTLINAQKDGLLKKVGHGKYSLTAHGRRIVEEAINSADKGPLTMAQGFRNPDTDETWCGRGRRPTWLRNALKNGISLGELKIANRSDTDDAR